jgi:hypothetical protein
MASINAVTTASKELGSKVFSKIRGLVPNSSASQVNTTAQAPGTDTIKLTDSNFNEITFSELHGDVPRKKLSFLEGHGGSFLLWRKTPGGAYSMYKGTAETKMHKECLITSGATAVFPELVTAALTPDALEAFAKHGFTKLTFQVGEAIDLFRRIKPAKADCFGLEIEVFDFNEHGLDNELRACLAEEGKSLEGMVITHAGECIVSLHLRRSIK